MIVVKDGVFFPESDIEWTAIRAQGAGGQNVNKVSSAVHLRFNIHRSKLSDQYKSRLLNYKDQRITQDGVVIIKAQQFRTQEQNRLDAIERLVALIKKAIHEDKKRRSTKPTKGSVRRRLENKNSRSKIKSTRGRVRLD